MKKILTIVTIVALCAPLIYANLQTNAEATSPTKLEASAIQQAFMTNPNLLKTILESNKEVVATMLMEILEENSEQVFTIAQSGANVQRENELYALWAEDAKKAKKVNLANRPSRGAASLPVTLVAFSDFTCSYCAQAAATVENLLAEYPNKIRFVFKQVPDPRHEVSNLASLWFLAAMAQDQTKGWNFYAAVFSNQQAYMADPTTTLKKLAESVGLNVGTLEADLAKNRGKYQAIIAEDNADMQKLGLSGTPHFLMNDVVIRGALPLADFILAYEYALKIKK